MSKVLKRLYLGDVVKSFGTKQLRKLTTEEPINDPYGLIGTWVFNDTITPSTSSSNYYIDFTSNGTNYMRISVYTRAYISNYGATESLLYRFEDTTILNVYTYYNKYWRAGDSYKTITITGGADIENETFKTWLKANATKQ